MDNMKFLFTFIAISLTSAAHAFPKAPFDALKNPIVRSNDKSGSTLIDYDFEGIIKLNNCSGSLIRFSGQPMTSKAIVLTNGHCYSTGAFGGMIKPGQVVHNKAASRDMKIFNKEMKLFPVKATKVLYATMTNTDIALYELSESYESISNKYKIESFELDTIRPFIGTNIDIVSGYWDRGYSCAIDAFIFKLQEAEWSFTDSIRYTDGCETVGGTSGSPIISRGTRSVIAINNTANESGKKCTMNNPCEVSEDGNTTVLKNKKYGQQTYNIYSCLRPDFNIDLSLAGCTLPQPK
jgi:V8-like Glu-specific endopeptidase